MLLSKKKNLKENLTSVSLRVILCFLALCPEHPKRDQNPKFTTLSETTSIPVCFIWVFPLPPPGVKTSPPTKNKLDPSKNENWPKKAIYTLLYKKA